jgi:hypothetical protein
VQQETKARDETKQEMKETKESTREVKAELMVLAMAQDETKQEMKEAKQEMQAMGGRILSLEANIDAVLSLLGGGGVGGARYPAVR